MTVWEDIATERRALADVFDELDERQWDTPSLCGEWTVRELAAHLVMPFNVSMPRFGLAMLRHRGNFAKANIALTARLAGRPVTDLISDYRAHAESHFAPPGMPPVTPLAEVLIHGQDARIPLGIGDTRAPELWATALDFLVSPLGRRGFVAGRVPEVELIATDVQWRSGSGPQVSGPAYAIGLTLTRRAPGLESLSGPGRDTLATWMG